MFVIVFQCPVVYTTQCDDLSAICDAGATSARYMGADSLDGVKLWRFQYDDAEAGSITDVWARSDPEVSPSQPKSTLYRKLVTMNDSGITADVQYVLMLTSCFKNKIEMRLD